MPFMQLARGETMRTCGLTFHHRGRRRVGRYEVRSRAICGINVHMYVDRLRDKASEGPGASNAKRLLYSSSAVPPKVP